MAEILSHLAALKRMLSDLEEDIQANPDPRAAMREHLAAAITYIEVFAVNDGNQASAQGQPVPVNDRIPSPLISPEITGQRQPRIYRFRDVMEAYLREHGSTHRTKLARLSVERGVFEFQKDALAVLTRLFHVWRDVFMSDGNGYYRVRPNARPDAKPRWSTRKSRDGAPVKGGAPSSKAD